MHSQHLFSPIENIPCNFAIAFWGYNRTCDFKSSEVWHSIEVYVYLGSEVGEFIESAVRKKVIDACDHLILHKLQLVVDEVGM